MVELALVSDDRYFPGLCGSVFSLIHSCSEPDALHFHLFDGGVSKQNWDWFFRRIDQHLRPSGISIHKWDSDQIAGIPVQRGRHPLMYVRLCLSRILDTDRVIYVDSDFLVFEDILKIARIPMEEKVAMMAVPNEDGATLQFEFGESALRQWNLDPEITYFNTGLTVMNLGFWRKYGITEKCLSFLREFPCDFADQSALNRVLAGRIAALPSGWNRLANHLDDSGFDSLPEAIHYTTDKPWLIRSDRPTFLLYRLFLRHLALDPGPWFARRTVPKKPEPRRSPINTVRMLVYSLAAAACFIIGQRRKAGNYRKACVFWAEILLGKKRNRMELRKSRAFVRSIAETWETQSKAARTSSDG